jgi:predicted dehydrogenase
LSFEDGTIGSLSGYGTLPAGTPGGITADFEIVGSDGTVSVDTPGDTVEITDADGSDRPDTRHWPVVNGRMDGAVRRQMDTFVRAIRDDGELLASLRDGVRAQEIADALREALDSDGAVQVDRHR